MKKTIEQYIVEHPTEGKLIKYMIVTRNSNDEIIDTQFWGYDEIGIENGGITEPQKYD